MAKNEIVATRLGVLFVGNRITIFPQTYSGRCVFAGDCVIIVLYSNLTIMAALGKGEIQRKVLLLLLGGITLGLSGSPSRYFRILKAIGREWKAIERDSLYRAIRSLYKSRLLTCKENADGTTTLVLSKKGREETMTYELDTMFIPKQERWDGKWRVVIFDIPEYLKDTRDILRARLKQIGMIELQKSVFIHPYPCEREVEFLTEYYEIRPHVRFITAESVDNELHLKSKFKLT